MTQSDEFWTQLKSMVLDAIPDDLPREWQIPPAIRNHANHGISESDDALRTAGFTTAADSLARVYREALRSEILHDLRDRRTLVQRDLDDWPEMHLERIKYRDRLVEKAFGDSADGRHLLRLYSEMDERLEEYLRRERDHRREGFRDRQERDRWQNYQTLMNERQEEIDRILLPVADEGQSVQDRIHRLESMIAISENRRNEALRDASANEDLGFSASDEKLRNAEERIRQCQDSIDDERDKNGHHLAAVQLQAAALAVRESVNHLVELQDERRGLDARIQDEESAVHRVKPDDVRRALNDEILNLKSALRLSARFANTEPNPTTTDGHAITVAEVMDAFHHVLDFDPAIHDNNAVARFGAPDVMWISGLGQGIFDAPRQRFVIPAHAPRSTLESIAHAAWQYRLAVDTLYEGRVLQHAFRRAIGANRTISALELRRRLGEAYVRWITEETIGAEVLTREQREWFESTLGPDVDAPRIPREYRNLRPRQIENRIEILGRTNPSADHEWRLAALKWLQTFDHDDALPHAENAVDHDPTHIEALWSLAVLRMKAGRMNKALDAFKAYQELETNAWWITKAKQLSARCF